MATPAQAAYEQAGGQGNSIKPLVLSHLRLVRSIVNRVCGGLELGVCEEDLISAGTLGLVEAAHRYDSSIGVQFSTFAYFRIKGAVVDCLRANDRLSKSARRRLSELRSHIGEFRKRHARRPTIEELADQADMEEEEVLQYLSYEKWDYVGSLEDRVPDSCGEGNVLAGLIAADAATPLEQLQWKERIERVVQAIERLPQREKEIIVMYYYEDLYMGEMAEVLGISESRVSQLHTQALYNLTRELEGE
ncbi:MAG: sigma-70 family RNA polymerase sigma factor [Planctomycetota bacterium]|jgi:RNA polymerase sigma factor for flagellar operon FliA